MFEISAERVSDGCALPQMDRAWRCSRTFAMLTRTSSLWIALVFMPLAGCAPDRSLATEQQTRTLGAADESPTSARSPRCYAVTSLGTLGGRTSNALHVNNRDEVVGYSLTTDGHMHGFHWRAGILSDLGTLGGESSQASDINDRGQIVGWADDAQGHERA